MISLPISRSTARYSHCHLWASNNTTLPPYFPLVSGNGYRSGSSRVSITPSAGSRFQFDHRYYRALWMSKGSDPPHTL
ncbi:unnamed protein product [Penicillium roqueforti FM164]|uniref:Uncharacterized protein n=1 Tax=Penicillium roqueforti (strain FM164) TaxID=1365484 RepID=W6QKR8_PENRF|nr:unnamed protein product [Penicillium roqueforti FM164]